MKQMIEIEVPEGKIAVWEKDKVVFKNAEPHWKSLRTFEDCEVYLDNNHMCTELLTEYENTLPGVYSETICKYRIVVAALTNNEERHLTTGESWFPVIQFCQRNYKHCYGHKIIGKIKSKDKEYLVVGGGAYDTGATGLGPFDLWEGVSCCWSEMGIRSVSSKEIAEHISTYFGKLLFEVQYGGVNCNWEWIELNP